MTRLEAFPKLLRVSTEGNDGLSITSRGKRSIICVLQDDLTIMSLIFL